VRDWALPAGVPLTPRAAERLSREAAVQAFAPAARALTDDWGMGPEHPLHASRVQRWSEAVGAGLVAARDAEAEAYGRGRRPEPPPNAVPLLVVGVDGGRWQGREKDQESGSRWHEDKVLTVSSYIPGDGIDPEQGGRKPQKLATTHVATARDAAAFGPMAAVEAERRGYRQAGAVIGIGDGGNWIDPLFDAHFKLDARIIDWCHATEHLWDCARAAHGANTPEAAHLAEHLEALLWDGKVERVVVAVRAESDRLGPPLESDPAGHPRRVLANNVGYFTRHGVEARHMDYPTFRKKGWPIASGDTEAGVKQHGRRVKGSDKFWSEPGVESVLALRSLWLSQDERWGRHWRNRRAYVN
jgi:hypothetical protein